MGWLCASTHLPHPPLHFSACPAFNATVLRKKKEGEGGKALNRHYRLLYITLTRVMPGWGAGGRYTNVWGGFVIDTVAGLCFS